jgi:hypothetical protein
LVNMKKSSKLNIITCDGNALPEQVYHRVRS